MYFLEYHVKGHYFKQECIPVGCVPPTAVAVMGGSPPGTPRPGTPSPFVNRITDTCKNITFPQLCLRAVINLVFDFVLSMFPRRTGGIAISPNHIITLIMQKFPLISVRKLFPFKLSKMLCDVVNT